MKLAFRGAIGSCNSIECGAPDLVEVKYGGATRKTILLLLAFVSSNAVAGWVEVYSYGTHTAYADAASIHRAGNRVKMWALLDFKTIQQESTDPGNGYLSEIAQFEYNCKEQRARRFYYSWHSRHMGRGKVVSSDSDPSKWEPVLPGSENEILREFACGR
jgi:hypothetical protein